MQRTIADQTLEIALPDIEDVYEIGKKLFVSAALLSQCL